MSTDSPEKTHTLLRWGLDRQLAEWIPNGEDWSELQLQRAESAVRSLGAALGVFDETRADPVLSGAERYQWLIIERAVEAESRKQVRNNASCKFLKLSLQCNCILISFLLIK